jgi:prevent-host-death family protein
MVDLVGGRQVAIWQVQEAKTRLSELIEEADARGPQIITRHGTERAVILSIKDYRALTAHQPNLKEYLLRGPKVESFETPRDRDLGRNIRL